MRYIITRIIPSLLSSLFLVHTRESTSTTTGAINAINRSINDASLNGSGAINPETQRITRMFMIFEPTIFPIAMSGFHRFAAIIEVIISGVLVPIATIVRPIILSEIPAIFARSTAPVTNIFHPIKSTHIPPKTHIIAFQEDNILSISSLSLGIKLLCLSE